MASLAACGSVLGFESLTPLPEEASVSEGGGSDGSDSGGGGAGSTDADGTDGCAGIDLTKSTQHCGRCNHDCGGGACEGSVCRPVKLAEGLKRPQGLVVDDKNVFVAESYANRILRLDKTPPGPCSGPSLPPACVFTSLNAIEPKGMGIDDTNVYWTDEDHAIRSCPRAGCGGQGPAERWSSGEPVFQHLNGEPLPLELVVRDGAIFFPEPYTGAVRSVAIDTGNVTTYVPRAGSPFAPNAVAVDATNVYFTNGGNGSRAAEIIAAPRDASGAWRVVASADARTWGIGLSPTGTLYWTVPGFAEDSDGKVQASLATADGGAPIGDFAGAQTDPRALVVDAKNVYWVTAGNPKTPTGMVVYCPQTGCPTDGPIVLAETQRVPRHLTQDATALYWSNVGLETGQDVDGQVWKVAKP